MPLDNRRVSVLALKLWLPGNRRSLRFGSPAVIRFSLLGDFLTPRPTLWLPRNAVEFGATTLWLPGRRSNAYALAPRHRRFLPRFGSPALPVPSLATPHTRSTNLFLAFPSALILLITLGDCQNVKKVEGQSKKLPVKKKTPLEHNR